MTETRQPLLKNMKDDVSLSYASLHASDPKKAELTVIQPKIDGTQMDSSLDTVNEDMGFIRMTMLLTWKNYMMQCRRRPKWWACKILFAAVFFAILGLVRIPVTVTNEGVNYGLNYDMPQFISNNSLKSYYFAPSLLCIQKNSPPGYLAIIPDPSTNSHIQSVVDIMAAHWTIKNVSGTKCGKEAAMLPWKEGLLLKYFDNDDDLNNYCTSNTYGLTWNVTTDNGKRPVGAAIVFNPPSEDGTQWSYEIRCNSSNVPGTASNWIVNEFTHDMATLWSFYADEYLTSGFVQLQVFIDDAISDYIGKLKNVNTTKYTYGLTKGYQVFPTPAYEADNYWTNVAPFFGWFIIFGFVYPFSQVASQLVDEKSYKTKEGMKMMGATVATYWTAWYIWLFFEFTLIITLCWAVGTVGEVFKYSAPSIIFLWLYMFGLAVMTFGTLVSTIFDSPRTAATLCNVILIVGVISGFAGSVMTEEYQKNALCLLAPACLTISVTTLADYESGLIGLQWGNIYDEYQYFRFVNAILIMGLDAIIYFVLTLYLDRVWPSRYGQREPFYFLCSPRFWCPAKYRKENSDGISESEIQFRRRMSSLMSEDVYEPVGDEYTKKGPAISMRDLKKTFSDPFGGDVKAVKGVSLDMYEGEIFCLLGHNGAGKTTTIGMLTGLLEISGGDAFICGRNVKTEMREIRKSLGVCPQHDTLWPRLTAQEHLELFARLKGVPQYQVAEQATKVLELVTLSEKKDDFPPNMSGGQRRKLSLGIALIGGSKVVFLDEPTSGMDPQSRRATWDLIQREKKHRAIVLTTHFMDEADILGDRIAIMATGEVRCCGSSLFLKQKYGVGYTFVVSLEAGVKPSTVKNDVDDMVLEKVKDSSVISVAGGEIAYRLPFSETQSFPEMFEALDAKKKELKITGYGVSVTTLEEVFMKIGEDFGDVNKETGNFVSNRTSIFQAISKKNKKATVQTAPTTYIAPLAGPDSKQEEESMNHTGKQEADASLSKMFAQPTFQLIEQNEFNVLKAHCWAILYKRLWWAVRDARAMCFIIVLPCLLAALDFLIQNLELFRNYPNLVLDVNQWYSPDVYTVPYAQFNGSSQNELYNSFWNDTYQTYMRDDWGSLVYYPVDIGNGTVIDWKDKLLDHRSETYLHYTSVYFDPNQSDQITGGFNLSACHSFPVVFSMIDNWVLKRLFPSVGASITTSSYPLPVTTSQQVLSASVKGLLASMTLTIALVFVPVGMVFPVVQERKQQMKHQQLVSGVSFVSYWCGQFVADFLVAIPTCALIVAMVHIFGVSSFTGEAEGPFIMAILLFLTSVLPVTYLLSLLFDAPEKAQAALSALYILLGLVLSIVTFILMFYNDQTRKVNDVLKYFFRASPMFCLAYSLIMISFQPFAFNNESYWSYDVVGENLVAMAVESVLYFVLLLTVEYISGFPSLMTKLGFTIDVQQTNNEPLDTDVLEEQRRVRAELTDENTLREGASDRNVVHICGLRKVYKEPLKVAVQDLWFGIPKGEVFGFLGVNGAGKTTTLKMLTGDTHPSAGHAFIYNTSIENQIDIRRRIGYCPQFDAIFDLLTGYEHLKFYGTVKGLKGQELEDQIRVLLNALSLTKYKNRKAGTYSGGNKRKLSAAIAMIGNPPVVFLDEPSTGMDPVSRRHMWKFINTTMEGRCVILTTHSMEECEALCHRLGIMVDGQLRCLGTPQHLKSRFGNGYQLVVTFVQSESTTQKDGLIANAQEELNHHFKVSLLENNQNRATFQLGFDVENEGSMTLAQVFRLLESLKEKLSIVSYGLNQTTLEQIFVRMARQHGEVHES